jgi:hypothetical protein
VQRLSYVGELGFEIYINNIDAREVYKSIIKDGKKVSVYTFDDIMEKKIGQIFKLVDDQIKNENYLKN